MIGISWLDAAPSGTFWSMDGKSVSSSDERTGRIVHIGPMHTRTQACTHARTHAHKYMQTRRHT